METAIAAVPSKDKLILGDFIVTELELTMSYGMGSLGCTWCWQMQQQWPFATGMQQRSKHCHSIDYVVVRRRDRRDVQVSKAMCGAECWTDHRLVISKLNILIKPRRPQGKTKC